MFTRGRGQAGCVRLRRTSIAIYNEDPIEMLISLIKAIMMLLLIVAFLENFCDFGGVILFKCIDMFSPSPCHYLTNEL